MELQDRYIRFDWAVKRLLRHKANFGVLEGFLTVLIGIGWRHGGSSGSYTSCRYFASGLWNLSFPHY